MKLTILDDAVAAHDVEQSLSGLLEGELSGAFSCMAPDGLRTWTAYLASDWPCLFFTSQASTDHVLAMDGLTAAALCVWRQPEEWGLPLYGAQLYGVCSEVEGEMSAQRGLSALHAKFPGTASTLPAVTDVYGDRRKTCLVEFKVQSGKLLDEDRLGSRRFVRFVGDGA